MYRARIAIATSLMIATAFASSAIPAELVEHSCGVLSRVRDEQSNAPPPEVSVAHLAPDEPVQFPPSVSPATHFVTCARSMLVPTLNDAKILAAGYQMFVGSDGEGEEPRAAVFVGAPPNVGFAIVSGTQSEAEVRITARVLKEINTARPNKSLERTHER